MPVRGFLYQVSLFEPTHLGQVLAVAAPTAPKPTTTSGCLSYGAASQGCGVMSPPWIVLGWPTADASTVDRPLNGWQSRVEGLEASVQSIHASRRPAEQGQLLRGGGARRDPLKRVPQHRPADAHLFHGKIALEHATVRAEPFDAGLHVGAPIG